MIVIDVFILLLSLLCLYFITRIWQMVKGKGRKLIIGAFAYSSLIRILIIIKDITGTSFPTSQFSIGFYLLMGAGLAMLLKEIKSFHRG